MGRGNPNWIRAPKERRALVLRNDQAKTELSLGGWIFCALLGAAIAVAIIAFARSTSRGQ